MPSIAENLASVRDQIARACQRADRDPTAVTLIPVTKYVDLPQIQTLIDLGCTHFAESRPQQLIARAQHFSTAISWHQIGHLQRNKVKALLPYVSSIHSVDSLRLAEAISQVSGSLAMCPQVFLEVNVSGEQSKDGFRPDDLRAAWTALNQLPTLNIVGLMTMAPHNDDPEASRPTFRALRLLRDELNTLLPDVKCLTELSMGMSNDFHVAIEEGATLIRVGSLLFT